MKHSDEEALKLFVEESREHLSGIEEDLLVIEQDGKDAPEQIVDKVFRAIHTLKGSASFFAFTSIKKLSHAMENILGKFRSRELVPTPAIITVLLDGADALKSMVNDLANSENIDISIYVKKLESFLDMDPIGETLLPKTNDTKPVPDNSTLEFIAPVSNIHIVIDTATIYEAQQTGNDRFVFLLEIDLTTDAFAKSRGEKELLGEIGQIARVITTKLQPADCATPRYLIVLCTSSIDKDIFVDYLALPPERVSQILTGRIHKNADGQYALTDTIIKNLADKSDSLKSNNAPIGTPTPLQTTAAVVNQPALQSEMKIQSANPESSLRVNIQTLDKLMTLAGEMVLTRNELLLNASARNMQKILAASQRVDNITSELQEAIMSTRMQSIGIVFSKFRRVVRDLSNQLEKQIQLIIEGEDVELDKSIIEAVSDPLTHLVRNSVDHGIEIPAVREAAGKSPQGILIIRACHQAGQVLIEIIDDGKGIDPAVIRKKAIALGFADENTLANMTDREIISFIFKPGFSTAEKITEISGRGVGMDVVQSNLKSVGGSVDIDSTPGKGTTIRIKLPLTLAIIPSLLVTVQSKCYAIPQANLVELVRISAKDVKRKIETVGSAAVLRLRGELLPLIRVSDVLGITTRTYTNNYSGESGIDRRDNLADRRGILESEATDEKRQRPDDRRKSHSSAVNIVVVVAGDFKYGLIVDTLLDSSEIVVKPLGYHLCDCRGYAGATILGDGQVALILDVVGIRRLVEMKETTDAISAHIAKKSEVIAQQTDKQSFLIVENGEKEFFAIPVGFIARIEKIKENLINITAGKQVVKYRGGTLRLLSIEESANVKPRMKRGDAYAVVFLIGGREAGIIISQIIDTVNIPASQIDDITHVQPGIIGSAVILDSITLILDIFGIVKKCAPELSKPVQSTSIAERGNRILIVEDSVFFLQQIRSFVEDAGYKVQCAEDGVKGLAILKNSSDIDLVLTDIEMPNMNGLELTRSIRADQALKDLPVIAVTSVSGDNAEKQGLMAGIDEYLIKLDREAVLAAVKRHLNKTTQNNLVKELI